MSIYIAGASPYVNGIIGGVEVEQIRIQWLCPGVFDDDPVSGVGPEVKVDCTVHDMSTRF